MTSLLVDDPASEEPHIVEVPREALPPLTPRQRSIRVMLLVICALCAGLVLQLTVVSWFQHRSAQQQAFSAFRGEVANGTAPIGPTDEANHLLGLGTPVAYIEIPAIDLKEVVLEGTSSEVLYMGPGHRRDTPLPGQAGVSVVYGRRAAYGGPFADLASLHKGDTITVTTGQGVYTFKALGVRRAGMPLPPPIAANGARLLLVTAGGSAFAPNGLVRVDADLVGDAVGGPARVYTSSTLPAEELALKGDARTLWALVLWLQALLLAGIGAVWSWHRFGRPQTWIVFLPILVLVGLGVAGQVARLLPNLM